MIMCESQEKGSGEVGMAWPTLSEHTLEDQTCTRIPLPHF